MAPGRIKLGQNLAMNAPSWTSTIELWHSEVNDFTYGDSSYNFASIGHYTQVQVSLQPTATACVYVPEFL